jgi:LacI family gluconate utilization system Gnt-I transcriptional repressor
MADVARRAEVSAMTVSRALKGGESVSRATREKIMAAVEELGYVLDLSAGALSSKKTGFISVLIPSFNNSNFSETVHGISESLASERKQILVGYTGYDLKREEQLIETMLQRRPEGIILTGGEHTARARQILKTTMVPVIETWDIPDQPIHHLVGFSNAAMIEDMVARLVFRGYRRIAFIGGDESGDFRGIDRRRGYERAIETLGLPRAHVVPVGMPPVSIRHGGPAVVRLMQEWPEVEAVICVSDLCAIGVIMECHRQKWDIPSRLAVAGFGDFEISRYSFPSLTTVSVNCTEIGIQAGNLMLRATEGAAAISLPPSQRLVIPHSIIEREST